MPPLTKLPTYVTLDVQSQWHVSALLSAAIESMTLPSRLKSQSGSLQRLDQFENALNINGSQNIARLRMSVEHKPEATGSDQTTRQNIGVQSRDTRLPSREWLRDESWPAYEDQTLLDMDFFPTEEPQQSRARSSLKKTHVFGQAENYRGAEDPKDEAEDEDEDEDEWYMRARQRAAGLPLVYK
jgi:hypothetical protein